MNPKPLPQPISIHKESKEEKSYWIILSKKTIDEMAEQVKISWISPLITPKTYPLKEVFLGEWEIQVLEPTKKMRFEDIVKLCREDGWEPATVFHLLEFMNRYGKEKSFKSLLAPGSLCIDDFEYPGCLILSIIGSNRKLGLGNWRGRKFNGCNVLRMKRK